MTIGTNGIKFVADVWYLCVVVLETNREVWVSTYKSMNTCQLTNNVYYRPSTKLREGNIFSRTRLSLLGAPM